MPFLHKVINVLSKEILILTGIVLFALFIRLFNLGSMPLHLHQDEIMNGYVGRFIIENGKDLYGNKWPLLYFDNFGDYPNVIPMYISGIFTYVFGINEFGVRFPVAVLGALTCIPIYFLSKKIFKNTSISLICALLLAILPWHVVLSRATAENVMGSFIFLCGLWFFLHGIQREKKAALLIGGLLFFASYFFYASFRVIVPLTLFASFFITQSRNLWKLLVVLTVFFFALTIGIGRSHWGSARFSQTSIFTFNNQVNNQADAFAINSNPKFRLVTRALNNKPVLYARELIRQYLSYFSPNFLFTDGGHPDRYLVPNHGLLYISFLAIGFGALVSDHVASQKQKDKNLLDVNKSYLFFLFWILATAPLSAALTLDEVPNVHRSAFLGIMILFAVGYGMIKVRLLTFKKYSVLLLLIPMICIEGLYFFHQYSVQAPSAQALARYDERTILTKHILSIQSSYDTIILPREIFPIYYLFYSQNLSADLAGKFSKNLYIPNIGNIYFIDNDCPSETTGLPLGKNSLIVDLARCEVKAPFIPHEMILHKNKTDAYRLLLIDQSEK